MMLKSQSERKTVNHKPLSGFFLKLLAIICMTIDHIGLLMFDGNSAAVCHAVGRLAFPIFCFLLVEGYVHTKHFYRYLLRLGIFALLCEPVYDYACYRSIPY